MEAVAIIAIALTVHVGCAITFILMSNHVPQWLLCADHRGRVRRRNNISSRTEPMVKTDKQASSRQNKTSSGSSRDSSPGVFDGIVGVSTFGSFADSNSGSCDSSSYSRGRFNAGRIF